MKILHSIRVSILSTFQLLTDNVSYSIGNAGKKSQGKQQRKLEQTKSQTTMQPPREQGAGIGEGTVCSKGWKVLHNY